MEETYGGAISYAGGGEGFVFGLWRSTTLPVGDARESEFVGDGFGRVEGVI